MRIRIMLIILGVVGVAAVGGVLLLANLRADSYSIERTADIGASPDAVYAYLVDLHRWGQWQEPPPAGVAIAETYGGAPSGPGATYDWDGPGRVGKGHMEIVEATSPSRLVVMVNFARPFAAHNRNSFVIELRGSTTRVTWSMHGTTPYILKVLTLFVSVDRLMGDHFETGLARLKAAAESASATEATSGR